MSMFNIDRHYECFDSHLLYRDAYVSNCASLNSNCI